MNHRNLITQGDRQLAGGSSEAGLAVRIAERGGITLIRGSALHHGICHYQMLLHNELTQSFFSSILLRSDEHYPSKTPKPLLNLFHTPSDTNDV